MPIYQINIWICDQCKNGKTITEQVDGLDDDSPEEQMENLPKDERWRNFWPDEHNPILLCPECLRKRE